MCACAALVERSVFLRLAWRVWQRNRRPMRPCTSFFVRRLAMAALLVWSAGVPPDARGQLAEPPPRESAVKAAFLYRFGSFVDWPAGTFKGADDPLVIGVLGDHAVAEDLDQLARGRSIEGRPVQFRALRVGEPVAGVHVLFVGTLRPARLRELLAAVPGPVLVVTQQEGALQSGSVINFITNGSRVRFAASVASAEARGLRLSARLLAVAQSVEGRLR